VDHHVRRRALAARLDALRSTRYCERLLHTRYLTGFTGSNGQVVVAGALFMTDGRYTEQSARGGRPGARDLPASAAWRRARPLGVARLGPGPRRRRRNAVSWEPEGVGAAQVPVDSVVKDEEEQRIRDAQRVPTGLRRILEWLRRVTEARSRTS
jgi:hypothetical protein